MSKEKLLKKLRKINLEIQELCGEAHELIEENKEHKLGFIGNAIIIQNEDDKLDLKESEFSWGACGLTTCFVPGELALLTGVIYIIQRMYHLDEYSEELENIKEDLINSLKKNRILEGYDNLKGRIGKESDEKKKSIEEIKKEVEKFGVDVDKVPFSDRKELNKIKKLVDNGDISPMEGIMRIKDHINGIDDSKVDSLESLKKKISKITGKKVTSSKEMEDIEKEMISAIGKDEYKKMLKEIIKFGNYKKASFGIRKASLLAEERLSALEKNDN